MFNPNHRLSVEEALAHPYMADFHNPADEPVSDKIIVLPISDNTKYTVQEYRWGEAIAVRSRHTTLNLSRDVNEGGQ